MRPRKSDRHLPACVYLRHGSYYYVKRGRWTRIGGDLATALREAVAAARRLTGNVVTPTLLWARGGPPNARNVWREFKRAAAKAGVADVTLHDLRAMAATEADRQGLDARGLLGHKDRRTTAIYLRDKTVPVVVPPRMKAK